MPKQERLGNLVLTVLKTILHFIVCVVKNGSSQRRKKFYQLISHIRVFVSVVNHLRVLLMQISHVLKDVIQITVIVSSHLVGRMVKKW